MSTPSYAHPSHRGSYWAAALVALVTMCPALINLTALDLLRPTIAQHLGVSPTDAVWADLLGSAAFVFGFVVAADLTRRFVLQRLIASALTVLVIGSLGAALAPNLGVLTVARIAQGFSAGVVSSAIVVLLVTGFPTSRQAITVIVLGLGLFAATATGPLFAGLLEQTQAWRVLFGVDALLGFVAILLAKVGVASQPPPRPRVAFDVAILLPVASGLILVFTGIGELSYHLLDAPEVEIPLVLGLGALLVVFAAGWVQRDHLLKVSHEGRLLTLNAVVASSITAIGFAGLFGVLAHFLLQIRGIGAQDTVLLLWPAPAAAFIGTVLVGVVFTRRQWIMALTVGGVLLVAVAAWLLTGLTRFTGNESIALVAALLGMGASLSFVPAILLAVFTVPREMLGRALGLVALLPYIFLAGSRPFVAYFTRVWQTIHLGHLLWQQASNVAFSELSAQAQAQPTASGVLVDAGSMQAANIDTQMLTQTGLVLGMNDAAGLLMLITVLGAAVSMLLLLMDRSAPVERSRPPRRAR